MRPLSRALPALLVAAHLALIFGALARPDRALATRDVPQFHLPLRATLAALARQGLPEWNPFLQGGQPLLSDPSYSAFYPPTWLALLVPAPRALGLIVLLHVALAAWGAFRLARRLGCRPAVAMLAASGFAGGGAFVSLVHAYTLLPAMAWLPWAIDVADRAAAAESWRAAARPLAATAAVLAAVALNGEPATLLCTALAVMATATMRLPTRPLRAFVAGGAAFALAAVQLLPALARLAASARAGGLGWEQVARWSMGPVRLVELVLPRLLGSPARIDDGLYFGWGLHDLDFPYLLVLTPGLPLVVVGTAAIVSGAIPRRAVWGTLALGGLLFALGRHTPVLAAALDLVPGLSAIRYPEKFFLLTYAALVFAGALGWEALLVAHAEERRGRLDLPLALALLALALTTCGLAMVLLAPARVEDFLATHAGLRPPPASLGRAMALYRLESGASFGLAAALAAVLARMRFGRARPRRFLVGIVWLLLASELVWLSAPLVATLPAATLRVPPRLVHDLERVRATRIWSSADVDMRPELVLRDEQGLDLRQQRVCIERLDPAVGALWGLRYALSIDSALTLTPPARRARIELERLWREQKRTLVHRLLGAWSIDFILARRGPRDLFLAARAGENPPRPAFLAENPYAQPWARTVAAARSFSDPETALRAAVDQGLATAEREYLVGDASDAEFRFDPAAAVVGALDRGSRLTVEVRAQGPALLVVASTFDPGWRARLGTRPLPVLESGLGYLAVALPPGGGRVELEYHDRWLRRGGLVTLLASTLLGALALLARATRGASTVPARH